MNVPDVAVVPTSQSVQPAAPALYWIVYDAMSVTPTSGPHDTRNALRFSYWPNVFTWEPGPTVSTIVHVSLADGWDSWFPEASSAVVANSYTPSADAVNERKPKFPLGWTEYGIQIALPAVRYHRVMLATPVPFPSEAPYEVQKVSVFSYVGKGLAADVGASLSTITNDSVWLVPMSTDRGSLVKLYGGYVTLTWVTLSVGTGVKPFGQRASTSRKFRTVRFPAAITATFVNGLFSAIASV